jgi:hypothetical protein
MTLYIVTQSPDGSRHSWPFPIPRTQHQRVQFINSALELAGPGSTILTIYKVVVW